MKTISNYIYILLVAITLSCGNKPQTPKILSDDELLALGLANKEKAIAQRKKKEMKGCGCCPVEPSKVR